MKKITTSKTLPSGETVKFNPIGFYVTDSGKLYKTNDTIDNLSWNLGKEYIPKRLKSGYLLVPNSDLQIKNNPNSVYILEDGTPEGGQLVHHIVTFSFGDRNGNKLSNSADRPISGPLRYVIDHWDGNHENNSTSNLQIVREITNLWRAYYCSQKLNPDVSFSPTAERYFKSEAELKKTQEGMDIFEKEKSDPEWLNFINNKHGWKGGNHGQ